MSIALHFPFNPIVASKERPKYSDLNGEAKRTGMQYRFGIDKLKENMRERCRIRIKRSRNYSFQHTRESILNGSLIRQQMDFDEIFDAEIDELGKEIAVQDEIRKELRDELNEWFVQQLEEEDAYLIDMDEKKEIICPVCQKAALECTANEWCYKCTCGAGFTYHGDLSQLSQALQTKVDQHEKNCQNSMIFFVEPQTAQGGADGEINNILNAMCADCDYYCSL